MDTFLSAQEFQNSGRKVPIENFVVMSSKRISYLGFNYRLLPIDDCDQEKLKSRTFKPSSEYRHTEISINRGEKAYLPPKATVTVTENQAARFKKE